MDLEIIKKIAFENMGDKKSHEWKDKGNKYYHGERVAKLALTLRNAILPGDSGHDDILTVAAWFHDISNGVEDHAGVGAEKTREILSDYCTPEELDEICAIIAVHDDRYSGRDSFSDYIKLHQDADMLDHFGTFYVWINFLYPAAHDQTMNDSIKWLNTDRSSYTGQYRNEINFDVSRKIMDEKIAFMEYFLKRFEAEGSGDIWDAAYLLP